MDGRKEGFIKAAGWLLQKMPAQSPVDTQCKACQNLALFFSVVIDKPRFGLHACHPLRTVFFHIS
jgi:hypothetical protein